MVLASQDINIIADMEGTTGIKLHNNRQKLRARFDILRKLGQGTYGKVQLAINKDTGEEVRFLFLLFLFLHVHSTLPPPPFFLNVEMRITKNRA